MLRPVSVAILLSLMSVACRGEDGAKLDIGIPAAPPAAIGFSVEDARPDSARKSSIERDGQTSFVPSVFSADIPRGAVINFGDGDLGASPTALLAGKLGARLGDKLAGKVLRVRKFSFTATKKARDALRLEVTISAQLGEAILYGRDFGDVPYHSGGGDGHGPAARLVDSAMESALYSLHRAEAAAERQRTGRRVQTADEEDLDPADTPPERAPTAACLVRIAKSDGARATAASPSANVPSASAVAGPAGAAEAAIRDTARADKPRLIIGGLDALPRPPGFVVDDARPEAERVSSSTKTYSRPFWAPRTGRPEAIFSLNFGDLDLNVSPADLLAETLIADQGAALAGKTLVIEEFSFKADKRLDRPTRVTVIPGGGAGHTPAFIFTVDETALLQSLQNSIVRLKVNIVATLDGKRIDGNDFGDVLVGDDHGATARIVQGAMANLLYNMDCADDPPAEAAPVETASDEASR